jgi:hypothetical protein
MKTRPLAVLLLIMLAVPAAAAAAAPPVSFGLRPVGKWPRGFFVYHGRSGQVLHGSVSVVNSGRRTGVVKLYPVDATTGQTSGTVYLTSGERLRGAGAWISLGARSLTLGPSAHRTVAFTVHVPRGTPAGQHVGGIAAETVGVAESPSSQGKTNVQIKIRNLSIVAVEVNVPGRLVARLAIGGIKAGGRRGYQQLLVHLRNSGNVMLKPRGTLTVEDGRGRRVAEQRFVLDTMLPGTEIDYPVNVTKRGLGAGSYRARVRIAYAGLGGGGRSVAVAQPSFRITSAQQNEVFRPAAPATPPPAPAPAPTASTRTTRASGPAAKPKPKPRVTTARTTPAPPPAAVAAPAAKSGSGMSTITIVLLALGGVLLLGLGYVGATWRIRRSRPSSSL